VEVDSTVVVTPPCVAVVVRVSVAGTTGDGDGDSDATGKVGVSLIEGGGSVGCAVNVWATAVLNNASEVAAESIVGPVVGVRVGVGSPWQEPSNKERSKLRTKMFFFIMPSFGLSRTLQ
jgi:hypothetical protein